jgi:hypothetical protein
VLIAVYVKLSLPDQFGSGVYLICPFSSTAVPCGGSLIWPIFVNPESLTKTFIKTEISSLQEAESSFAPPEPANTEGNNGKAIDNTKNIANNFFIFKIIFSP